MGVSSKTRVLVIDDEPGVLRFVKTGLSVAGYEVFTTTSGAEGLRLVLELKPDIMLLDILMSPVDGLEVLKKLRLITNVPVIAFTARSDAAELARENGADGFIAKPFLPEKLINKIQETLKQVSD